MLQKMLKKLSSDKFLLALIVLSLIPTFWFKKGLFIAGGDESWIINPLGFWPDYLYAWNGKAFNMGGPNIYIPYVFPLVFIWMVLSKIGLTLVIIEKIWIVILFGLPGISMYFLVKNLFSSERHSNLTAFMSALLYTFNLFVIQIGPFQTNTKLMMIALPLSFLLFKIGLEQANTKNSIKYAIFTNLALLVMISGNVNIAVTSIVPLILIFYFIFFFICYPLKRKSSIIFASATSLMWLLLNVWWFAPFLINSFQFNESSSAFSFQKIDTEQFYNFFRFLGSWGWKETHNHSYYFPFWLTYDNPLFLTITYGMSLIGFLAIIFKPKNKNVIFLTLLALIGIFLAKGSTPPFGEFYNFLFFHIKILWIYREPWAKFTPIHVFAISVLFGLSFGKIHEYVLHKLPKYKFLVPVCGTFLVLATAYPLLNGMVVWKTNTGLMRSNYVKIPNEWNDVNQWLLKNSSKNDRVLLIPPTGYAIGHQWENGFFAGDTPAMVLLDNKIVKYTSFPTTRADKLINNMYLDLENNPQNLIEYANKFNIKYVLYDQSIDYNYSKFIRTPDIVQKNAQNIASSIKSADGLNLKFYSGTLTLYSINGTDINNNEVSVIKDNVKQKIIFSENNPTSYIITLKSLKAPYALILNENFNMYWSAYSINNGKKTKLEHFIINDFANAWNINQDTEKVVIENKLQKIENVGILVSIITFLILLIFLFRTKSFPTKYKRR